MPFHLILHPPKKGDPTVKEILQQYIEENNPIITREADGRVLIGVILFDTLETRISSVRSLDQLPNMVDECHKANTEHAVCLLFEQSTGNPLLVVVKEEEVAALTALLDSGFSFMNIYNE